MEVGWGFVSAATTEPKRSGVFLGASFDLSLCR